MLRKFLFYIFILIYFISCPLIILDALGIIIKPGRHKLMQATGLISIATIPEGALIYINDRLYPQKSPAIIRDLAPNSYKVTIQLNGHHIWQKNIAIEHAQATALENILLIPWQWDKQPLGAERFTRLLASPGNPFFFLQSTDALKDLYVYYYKDSRLKPLFLTPQPPTGNKTFLEQKVSTITTIPQSAFIFLELSGENADFSYWWVDTKQALPKPENLSAFMGHPLAHILWDKDNEKNIFYSSLRGLARVDIDAKTVVPHLVDAAKGYGLLNQQLYFIDNTQRLMRLDYSRKNAVSLTELSPPLPTEFPSDSEYSIHLFSEDIVVFLTNDGKLLSNKLPYTIVPQGVIGFTKELNDNQMIFWTKEKIGIIDFTKADSEGLLETGPSIRWLNLTAKNISQVFWVNKGSHILYKDLNSVKIVEATDAKKPLLNDVIEASGEIAYFDKIGKLFYLDVQTQKLMSLTILPSREFITFKLPKNFHKKEIK